MLVVEEEINKGLVFGMRTICFDSNAFFNLEDSAFPLRHEILFLNHTEVSVGSVSSI